MSAETVHLIDSRFETLYQRDYAVQAPDMRRLYENAKRDQWNVSKDIDWSQSVDLDRGHFRRRPDRRLRQRGLEQARHQDPARTQHRIFMLAAVATAPWRGGRDARVQPVGRHGADQRCQVFPIDAGGRRGAAYRSAEPLPGGEVRRPHLSDVAKPQALCSTICSGRANGLSRRSGLQLVAETFAVGLFRMLAETSQDPLLQTISKQNSVGRIAPHGLFGARIAGHDREP